MLDRHLMHTSTCHHHDAAQQHREHHDSNPTNRDQMTECHTGRGSREPVEGPPGLQEISVGMPGKHRKRQGEEDDEFEIDPPPSPNRPERDRRQSDQQRIQQGGGRRSHR